MTTRRAAYLLAAGSVGVLALAALLSVVQDEPFSTYSRDTFMTAEVSVLTGVLSNLGVFIWISSGCIALFAAAVCWAMNRDRRLSGFFALGGVLSGVLAFDDFFMLHELGFGVGINERIIFGLYGLLLAIFLWWFRHEIVDHVVLGPSRWLLAASLGLVTGSLVVDALQGQLEPLLGNWRIFFEDGFKFLGIVWWAAYFTKAAFDMILHSRSS